GSRLCAPGRPGPSSPPLIRFPTPNARSPTVKISEGSEKYNVRHVARTLAIVVCALSTSFVGQGGRPLTVTSSSPTLSPGSVVLLTVKASEPMTSLTGQAFGRPVRFWEAAPREWRGFVAADLER